MEGRAFQTALGRVPVWGDFGRFAPERRLLLVIRGAFAKSQQLYGLAERFPDTDVAFVHLPGMFSPFFSNPSVKGFAAAFDEVLAVFGRRHVVVLGLSLGGTVALAMRSPDVKTLLLVDSLLDTQPLWMLPQLCRPRMDEHPELERWSFDLLGVSRTEVVRRDYRPLLADLSVRTGVLVGSELPGAPRPIEQTPSLVSEDDRALYRAHPLVTLRVVPGTGHNIPRDATGAIVGAVQAVIALPD